jgi:hypothetical protein
MKATVEEQVGRRDLEMEARVEPHPMMGIGLPMSNIFAT